MILLIFLLFGLINSTTEVCERFTSHIDFKNCIPAIRREFQEFQESKETDKICPNLGTWSCALFYCTYLISEEIAHLGMRSVGFLVVL